MNVLRLNRPRRCSPAPLFARAAVRPRRCSPAPLFARAAVRPRRCSPAPLFARAAVRPRRCSPAPLFARAAVRPRRCSPAPLFARAAVRPRRCSPAPLFARAAVRPRRCSPAPLFARAAGLYDKASHALTALTLAALLPLAAPPAAHAQWALESKSASGPISVSYTDPDGTPEAFSWDIADWMDFTYGGDNEAAPGFGPIPGGGQGYGNASISCTQTFVFDWVGDGPPPKEAYFLVTGAYALSEAYTGITDFGLYGPDFPPGLVDGELGGMQLNDPDDGLGDKPVAVTTYDNDLLSDSGPFLFWGPRWGSIQKISSSPGHLVQQDGSSGEVTISITGSAGASGKTTNQTYPFYGYCVAGCVTPVTVVSDSRGVMVVSSLGTTYHKGNNNQPVANERAPSGAIVEDTVVPKAGQPSPINYGADTGYAAGEPSAWGQPSTYSWSSRITGAGGSGTWNDPTSFGVSSLPYVPDYPVTYSNPPVMPGQVETVKVKVQDASLNGGSAEADNEDIVNFHPPTEMWTPDSGFPAHHPLITQPSPDNYNEWTLFGTEDNNDDKPQAALVKATLHQGLQVSNTGSIGDGADVGLDAEGVKVGFQTNEHFDTTNQYTFSADEDVNWQLPAHSHCWKFWAFGWTEHRGKCDVYQTNGFRGRYGYYGIDYDGLPGAPGISTYVYHVPAD